MNTIPHESPEAELLFAEVQAAVEKSQAGEDGLSQLNSWGALIEFAVANFMLQAAYQGVDSDDQDELVSIAIERAHPLADVIHEHNQLQIN